MSRRSRNRPDKRAIAAALSRTEARERRDREPDELTLIDGTRIDLRKPWTLPTTTKGPKP